MNKRTILFSFLLFLSGCGQTPDKSVVPVVSKDSATAAASATAASKDTMVGVAESVHQSGIPDFFKLGRVVTGATAVTGYLGGNRKNDLAGPFVKIEYYSDTLSFDLVFYPKNRPKSSVELASIDSAAANGYRDYICFGFVYPMEDPDLHQDNISFPLTIKAYVRKDDHWEYRSKASAKDFAQLSGFEINTINEVVTAKR